MKSKSTFLHILLPAGFALSVVGSGCDTSLGVAEGVLDSSTNSSFNGISDAKILSPSTVQVTWNASSKYSAYKVFSAGASAPLTSSLFSSATLTGLTPNTRYVFSVAGVPIDGGNWFGSDSSLQVTTWPQFQGVDKAVAAGPTTINVSWKFPVVGPTYRVYVNKGAIPTDFSTPDYTTQGLSAVVTTWGGGTPLGQADTYYVVVRASYLDATSEANTNAAQVTTPSAIDPMPTLAVAPSVIGGTPVITVANALPTYKITFNLLNPDGVTTTLIGTHTIGNGNYQVPSSKAFAAGPHTIKASVQVGPYTAALPDLTVVTRKMGSSVIDAPLLFGKGRQLLGSSMSVGDFNCDGSDDLAVGAPWGTFHTANNINGSPSNGINNGGVYVFYGGGPQGLILPGQVISGVTVPEPSTVASGKNPLLISFPATSYANAIYTNTTNQTVNYPFAGGWRGILFGFSLAAGNLNGDTQVLSSNTYQCDDLAISAPGMTLNTVNVGPDMGGVFVYYGGAGGLQLGAPATNGPACNGLNCTPQLIVPTAVSGDPRELSGDYRQFGTQVRMGNVTGNSSGFHDLVVSAANWRGDTVNGAQAQRGAVFVYKSNSSGVTFTTGVNAYAAQVLRAPATVDLDIGAQRAPGPFFGSFGQAIALADTDGDGKDDLYVGSPYDTENVSGTNYSQRGSVYYYRNLTAAGVVSFAAPTRLTSAISATFRGNYLYWGGALANIGDANGDGIADIAVGTGPGTGSTYHGSGNDPNVLTIIYGASGSGPQGFASGVPSSPALNAMGCTTSCSATSCAGCKVQMIGYFGAANRAAWLDSWGRATYNPAGLVLSGAKTQHHSGLGYLPLGGQRINSDDYADLLVGIPSSGANGTAGSAAVLAGSKNGVTVVPTVISPVQALPGDHTGMAVAMGVFKTVSAALCPTVATAALSAPANSTLGNGPMGGVVYTFQPTVQGGNCTLGGSPTLATQLIKSNLSGEIRGAALPMQAFPAGDLNNDTYTDLVVTQTIPSVFPGATANYYDSLPARHIQVNTIYYGGPGGIDLSVAPSLNPMGTDPLLIAPPTSSGCSAAGQVWCYDNAIGYLWPAGDVNGDGFADLFAYDGWGGSGTLYYGSASGLQHASSPQATATGLDPIIYWGYTYGSPWAYAPHNAAYQELEFSRGYTFGDFNGDGMSDMALSSSHYGGPPNNVATQGRAIVVYGGPSGYQIPNRDPFACDAAYNSGGTKTWPNGNTTYLCGTRANLAFANPCDGASPSSCLPQQLHGPLAMAVNTYFGGALGSAGDLNADGYDDLLVAASHEDTLSGLTDAGVVFVYYGSARGLVVSDNGRNAVLTPGAQPVYSPVIIAPGGRTVSSYLGYRGAYGAGDVNGDGFGDLLISSMHVNYSGAGVQGSAFLYYGCHANQGACPNTGIYGVSYNPGSGTFVNAALQAPACAAGSQSCIVKNAPSCIRGGACSPLTFAPTSNNGYTSTPYWSSTLGTLGDLNQDGYSEVLIGSGWPNYYNGPSASSTGGYSLSQMDIGQAVVYSGGPTGLVLGSPSFNPNCTAGQGCAPYLLQPPTADWGAPGFSEPSQMMFAGALIGYGGKRIVDFNGDGRADFLVHFDSFWNKDRTALGKGALWFFQ